MDQRTRGLNDDSSPRAAAESLSGEIITVRGELDTLLGELDRRRHEALDVRLQIRRHALGVTLSTVAIVGTAAGFVWLGLRRRHERQQWPAQAGRLRQAVARMIDQPDRVAAEPTVVGRIVAAAASAGVASLVKKLLEVGVEWLRDRQAAPTAESGEVRRPSERTDPSRLAAELDERPPQSGKAA